MLFYKIKNNCINFLFLFIIIFFTLSCSFNKSEELLTEEVPNETIAKIESNTFIKYNNILDFWSIQNSDNFIVNYNFEKYDKFNFGKGKKNHQELISNPLFINNKIFLVDNNGKLTKYDFLTNNIDWEIKVEESSNNVLWPASLVSNNDLIVVTTGNGNITCYNMDGSIMWTKKLKMTSRTPSLLIDNIIVVFLNNGELLAYDIATGDKIWNFNKNNNKISAIEGGKFFKNKNILIAISPKGETYFIDYFYNEYSELEENFNNVFIPKNFTNFDYFIEIKIFKNNLIIVENNKLLSIFNLLTNNLDLQNHEILDNEYLKILNNVIFILDENKILRALNITNGNMFWLSELNEYIKESEKIVKIIESENNFVVFTSNGKILFLNKKTGEIIKEIKLKIKNIQNIYMQEDYILFITESAELFLYN